MLLGFASAAVQCGGSASNSPGKLAVRERLTIGVVYAEAGFQPDVEMVAVVLHDGA